MGIVETHAVVLNTFKLAEADKIVVCMTEKAGLIRGVARGARRLKSRFGASLEPFTLVNLTFFEKEGRELVTFKHAEILKSYFGSARDEETVASLGYLVELVKQFAAPNQADDRLFRMLRACVDSLVSAPASLPAVLTYAELWVLQLAGFLPDFKVCGRCRRRLSGGAGEKIFMSGEGVLWCGECGEGQPLSGETYKLLSSMRASPPSVWASAFSNISPQGQRTVADTARRLVRRVIERDIPAAKFKSTISA